MVVVLFHIKLREDVDTAEYQRTAERMVEIVSGMPGFRDIAGFTGEDGSELAVARFDSDEAAQAWKCHPEHVRTQERARAEFFEAYDITVAEVIRRNEWSATVAASMVP
jgi:heme-degrading monooxygenase HmoA